MIVIVFWGDTPTRYASVIPLPPSASIGFERQPSRPALRVDQPPDRPCGAEPIHARGCILSRDAIGANVEAIEVFGETYHSAGRAACSGIPPNEPPRAATERIWCARPAEGSVPALSPESPCGPPVGHRRTASFPHTQRGSSRPANGEEFVRQPTQGDLKTASAHEAKSVPAS